MIKVYIAAPTQQLDRALSTKQILEANGMHVTSRWITLEDFNKKDKNPLYLATWSVYNLVDVDEASMLLLINSEGFRSTGTGGRHVEFGYAIARRKPIILYGEKTNVFHWHPYVTHLEESGDLVKTIKDVYERRYILPDLSDASRPGATGQE